MEHLVTVFKPYPFEIGEKIKITDSHRAGDWEVIGVSETKLTLRCPISKKEVTWDRFCCFVDQKKTQWPSD
ncbi:MAG: hypothetical protein ABIJ31_06960 [Pseudomonadota bacterium]